METPTTVPKEEFEAALEAAFGMLEAPVQATSCGCDECLRLNERLAGKHWRTMTDEELPIGQLSLLSGEMFRFVLPAILRAINAAPYDEEVDWLYFSLGREEERDRKSLKWFLERIAPLTVQQAALVYRVYANRDPELIVQNPHEYARFLEIWRRRATPTASEDS